MKGSAVQEYAPDIVSGQNQEGKDQNLLSQPDSIDREMPVNLIFSLK